MIIILGLLMSFSVNATEITCSALKNLDQEFSKSITVEKGQKVEVGEVDEFKFSIKNIDDKKFEIEVYDRAMPSRQYTEGSGRELKWTLWARSILLELSCRLGNDQKSFTLKK